uniref:imelysin family protein n=1 Tax=Hoylesella marshii TaxID=189722 RepID=UPI0028D18F48
AYRSAIGKPETHKDENGNDVVDDPNYIESPYSYNSFTDFYGNIMSIQNALYGNLNKDKYESNSIMAYLQKYNSEMANNLQNKLTAALDALKACQNSGTSFVKDPGATYVKTAMDKIGDLDKALNESANWILAN